MATCPANSIEVNYDYDGNSSDDSIVVESVFDVNSIEMMEEGGWERVCFLGDSKLECSERKLEMERKVVSRSGGRVGIDGGGVVDGSEGG